MPSFFSFFFSNAHIKTDIDTDTGTYTDTLDARCDTRHARRTCIAREGEDHMITVVKGTCIAVHFFWALRTRKRHRHRHGHGQGHVHGHTTLDTRHAQRDIYMHRATWRRSHDHGREGNVRRRPVFFCLCERAHEKSETDTDMDTETNTDIDLV